MHHNYLEVIVENSNSWKLLETNEFIARTKDRDFLFK